MRTFKDTRGKSWFDIVEGIDGQIDITVNYPGTIRAFHRHQDKVEWMFVVEGEFKFVLTDPNEVKFLSQGEVIKIDTNRWHGYQALGDKPGIMMEFGSNKHNVENPDDERKVWDKFDKWEKDRK